MNDSDTKNAPGDDAKLDKPEDMSLADLLGGDTASEQNEPKRVNERIDEPGSGVVRLSQMVADASPEQVKVPSVIPPSAANGDLSGPQSTQPGAVVLPPAKSSGGLIVGIVIAIAAIAAIAVVLVMQKGDEEKNLAAHQEKMAALEAQLAKMSTAQADQQNMSEQAKQEMEKLRSALAAAKMKEVELAKEVEEAEKPTEGAESAQPPAGEPQEEPKVEKKVAAASVKGKSSGGSSKAKAVARKSTAQAATKSNDSARNPAKKEASAESKPKKTDELDDLLGGKKEKVAVAKPAPAGDGVPKVPAKSDIKTAMAPVATKAQKCSKYSTGTVQLQITIGNNGRVKASKATGSFANTTAGKCVEMLARTAKFPKFKDPTFSFRYPVILR